MKLIIDLPEDLYKWIKDKYDNPNGEVAYSAIKNGIPYEENPHGKWVKIFENPFTNGYVCPFCGHKIQVTEEFLPEVTECEACGAELGGDTPHA